jgi:hypothetical protein
MDEPVSLLDLAIRQLQTDVNTSVAQGKSKAPWLPAGWKINFTTVYYDRNDNQIKLQAFVTYVKSQKLSAESCKKILQGSYSRVLGADYDSADRDSAVNLWLAHYFTHRGYQKKDTPKDLLESLKERITLEVRQAGGPFCRSPISKWEFQYMEKMPEQKE